MKKLICVVLTLALCLCAAGCAATKSADNGQTVAAAPADGRFFSLKTLPEIGTYVPDEKAATFFSDGAHDGFTTGNDYGSVVPYYANVERYASVPYTDTDADTGEEIEVPVEDMEVEYYSNYGLMTADGRIITKGIYKNVFLQSDGSDHAFYAAFPEVTYEMYGKMDLIGTDGTWCLHFTDDVELRTFTKADAMQTPLFTVSNEKTAKLYDYDGNEIADLSAYLENEQISVHLAYIDDAVLIVETYQPDTFDSIFTLYDHSGKRLAVLPERISSVQETYPGGVLLVYTQEALYQLTDIYGNALSAAYPDLTADRANGRFFARTRENYAKGVILDDQGKVLEPLPVDYNFVCNEGDVLYLYDAADYVFYDWDGKATPMDTDGKEVIQTQVLYDWNDRGTTAYLCAQTADDAFYFFDTSGKRMAVVTDATGSRDEGDDKPYYNFSIEKDWLTYLSGNDTVCLNLMTGQTRRLTRAAGVSYGYIHYLTGDYYGKSACVLRDGAAGNWTYEIVNLDADQTLVKHAVQIDSYGDMMLAATTSHSYVFDSGGHLILKLKNDQLF